MSLTSSTNDSLPAVVMIKTCRNYTLWITQCVGLRYPFVHVTPPLTHNATSGVRPMAHTARNILIITLARQTSHRLSVSPSLLSIAPYLLLSTGGHR